MPTQDCKVQTLTERFYQSMSRQLRSNNPVLNPAVCSITHLEFAGLAEEHLSLIVIGIQNRLKNDGHWVNVQYILTPQEPHACMIVSAIRGKTRE